jgi:protein-L-isoaspartate O-methyltransferase
VLQDIKLKGYSRQTVVVAMNYFAYPTAAERYAKGRPFFHSLAVEKIRTVCCEADHTSRALDVGCGTGQSTAALLELAHTIIGLDTCSVLTRSQKPESSVRSGRALCSSEPIKQMLMSWTRGTVAE